MASHLKKSVKKSNRWYMDLGKIGKMVRKCLRFRERCWQEGGTFLICYNGPYGTKVPGC